MSTTAYYNFITGIDKRQAVGANGNHRGSLICDARRQSAISPSSFMTNSTSTSSSSLNQFNSLTNNGSISISTINNNASNNTIETPNGEASMIMTTATPRASPNSSSLSSSSSSSSSSTNKSTYRRRHSSLLRKSSITPTQPHHTSQMFHSYTLHSLEPKPFKPFKTSSDYLEAMKEDLAEWLNSLYSDLELTPDNFFASLDNGAIICRHANHVTQMGRNSMHVTQNESSVSSSDSGLNDTSNFNISNSTNDSNGSNNKHTVYSNNNSLSSPTASDSSLLVCNNNKQEQHLSLQSRSFSPRSSLSSTTNSNGNINWFNIKMLPFKQDAKPGTFFARDNICQFILWCRSLNILECLLFETDDLVARKNEKSFILCLLEVARIGFKVGIPTPLIIQLEQEIDREIENEAKIQKKLEEDEKRNQDNHTNDIPLENDTDDGVCEESEKESLNVGDKKQFEQKNELSSQEQNKDNEAEIIQDRQDEEEEEDLGPKPQVITNDLVSLHEKVSLITENML